MSCLFIDRERYTTCVFSYLIEPPNHVHRASPATVEMAIAQHLPGRLVEALRATTPCDGAAAAAAAPEHLSGRSRTAVLTVETLAALLQPQGQPRRAPQHPPPHLMPRLTPTPSASPGPSHHRLALGILQLPLPGGSGVLGAAFGGCGGP